MLLFQPVTTHRSGMSAANLHHIPTKGKQSKLPERAREDIDVCKNVRHCRAAQTCNFTFPAQTSPLKRKFDPQFHFNLQELRFSKPSAICIMSPSSSGFISSLASLEFIFQMHKDTQSFSHKISWKHLHPFLSFSKSCHS